MFAFNFVKPYLNDLLEIEAPHEILMFILSKNIYLNVKEFQIQVTQKMKINKLCDDKFWN